MMQPNNRVAAFEGHHIKSKMFLALTLTSIIPLLILTYTLHIHVVPLLDTNTHWMLIGSLQGLLICTALLMAGGGYVIWDVAAAVVRTAQLVAKASKVPGVEGRSDQLDSAYKGLEATNSRLKDLSFKDEVTDLDNRRFFFIRLEEEISRFHRFGHPLSVVLLDLDDFKAVNDELGHTAGDDTLREVAQLMVKQSRSDTIMARYGGDEFAILLVETSKSGASCYAERIRQALADCPFSHSRQITASFGIASLPEDSLASSEALIRAADEALHAAKRDGKNSVASYEPELTFAQAQQD
jgi:diguanylate cyclase (GGDEF)-like protein